MKHKLDKNIKKLLCKGKVKEAYTALLEITSDDENENRYLNIKKASLASQCGYFFLADFFLILAKEGLPKNSQYYDILSEEAKIAFKAKEFERVIACCEESLSASKNKNGIIYLTLGHAQSELEMYEEALKSYKLACTTTKDKEVRRAANFSRASLSFALGDFLTAESAIKACISEEDIIRDKSINLLMNIYFKQKKYQEAAKFLRTIKMCFPKVHYDEGIDVILAQKTGNRVEKNSSSKYHIVQLLNYDKGRALKHIRKHHEYIEGKTGRFAANINLEELFENIKIQMTEENIIYEDILDTYEISCPNIGFDTENNPVDNLRIVAVPDTKNIITMYPSGKKAIKPQKRVRPKTKCKEHFTK